MAEDNNEENQKKRTRKALAQQKRERDQVKVASFVQSKRAGC
jgi:ribosomal protein L21E